MELLARHSRLIAALCAGFLVLFSAHILFYKLGAEPLQDYDEATYAEVTHESIAQGNPSSLSFLNQPYFRKPPLLFWLTTTSSAVFSDPEFAVRFPSALAGLAAIGVVVAACVAAGMSLPFALFGGAVLATTATWMEFARDVRFDNLVALFNVAAFYAGIRALRDRRWFLAVGIALALAVLSKNVMVAFAGVALLELFIADRGLIGTFQLLRDRYVWGGIGMFALIAVPWHLYQTITYGVAFWHSYLGTEVLERASANLFPGGNNPTNAQYAWYLTTFAKPWAQIFVAALCVFPFMVRDMQPLRRSVLIASLSTVLAVLAVMFSAGTKAYGYLMPMYPFVAIVVALTAYELWTRLPRGVFVRVGFACAFLYFIISGATTTRYDAFHINPYYGWEIGQAQEEYAIAGIIRAAPQPVVYAYNGYSELGSILFYSRLPDTQSPYVLVWSASSTPIAGSTSFILATSSLDSLQAAFPEHRFEQAYSGKFVSLFTVAD